MRAPRQQWRNPRLHVRPPRSRMGPLVSEAARVAFSRFLPPGTSAWYHQLSAYHDARHFFPKTDDFWPERWLLASGRLSFSSFSSNIDEATFMHNEAAFVPFSYGPMNCVGKNLAMLEMRVVVCVVLQKFWLHLRDGWDPQTYGEGLKDFFVTTRPPVPVTLVPRF